MTLPWSRGVKDSARIAALLAAVCQAVTVAVCPGVAWWSVVLVFAVVWLGTLLLVGLWVQLTAEVRRRRRPR